jgi:hypothetical protein
MGNMELFSDNKREIMKSSMIYGLQFSFCQLDGCFTLDTHRNHMNNRRNENV